jgi:hypothetical protein
MLRAMVVVLCLQSTYRRFASASVVTCEKKTYTRCWREQSEVAERRRRPTARALNAKLQKSFTHDRKNFNLTKEGYELFNP